LVNCHSKCKSKLAKWKSRLAKIKTCKKNANQDLQNANQDAESMVKLDLFCKKKNCIILSDVAPRRTRIDNNPQTALVVTLDTYDYIKPFSRLLPWSHHLPGRRLQLWSYRV
jgi:hypothetical protein